MKLEEVSNETLTYVKKRVESTMLHGLNWEIKDDPDLKPKGGDIGKIIIPKKEVLEVTDLHFLIVIREDIFDTLEDKYKSLVVDRLLAYVSYDPDTEKISKKTPDVHEHSLVLEKYPSDLFTSLRSEVHRIKDEISNSKSEEST